MKNYYKVKWEIDINASSPQEAVQKALEIQRDKYSDNTFFKVENQDSGKQYGIDFWDDKFTDIVQFKAS